MTIEGSNLSFAVSILSLPTGELLSESDFPGDFLTYPGQREMGFGHPCRYYILYNSYMFIDVVCSMRVDVVV